MTPFHILPIASTGALAVLAALSIAAQTEPVSYHDFAAIASSQRGAMKIKAVLGQTGSLAFEELPPGLLGTPHHHAQEQITMGLTGSIGVSIGGAVHSLGVYGAVFTPPNVEHFLTNSPIGPGTGIGYQPLRRTDWVPPHAAFKSPASEMPAALAPNRRVSADLALSSDGWQAGADGARSKVLSGETIRVTVWDLSAPRASADLNPKGARPEQFAYVVEGQCEIVVDSSRRHITSRTLALISSAPRDVRLRSLGKGTTVVAVFEPFIR